LAAGKSKKLIWGAPERGTNPAPDGHGAGLRSAVQERLLRGGWLPELHFAVTLVRRFTLTKVRGPVAGIETITITDDVQLLSPGTPDPVLECGGTLVQIRKILILVFMLAPIGAGLVGAGQTTAQTTGDGVWLPLVSYTSPEGIFISASEIARLPTSGAAWEDLLSRAQESAQSPDLSDSKDQTDAVVMAKALVYVRTGDPRYRQEVIQGILRAMGTEHGGDVLALGRNLAAYVVAADLVRLDGDDDRQFRTWLDAVRYERLDDRTLVGTHEERPNNWGTHAGAARIAADVYLGDVRDLERAASVFRGWLGDRSAYAGFNFNSDLSWQCNPLQPVPVNPSGCVLSGYVVDGVLPEDQRRSGSFQWPPPRENYVWEALQGVVAQARMLERLGYPAFSWQDRAILRAATWLNEWALFPASGDDSGTPWLINSVYGTNFAVESPGRPGKNGLGYYEWFAAGG
jgi:hypothetical protein